MKFKIDLLVVAAYICICWVYASLPDPNWWVFAYIVLMVFCIDMRSHKAGMDRGADLMQRIMRETLADKGWEIVRRKP